MTQTRADNMDGHSQGVAGAPNEKALLTLMERTGYSMIQENGQRKYGGPPPKWEGPPPPRGCEIFVGKIPRDCYEDELVPAFEKIGKIYELRLMMDFSGSNRGYAFVMYTNKLDAQKAVKEMNNFEIRKGRLLGVCQSVDNCRLFVGGIPKTKTKEEIMTEMKKVTDGVLDVIVYPSAMDKTKNRGFAFVEYNSHRTAAMARRKLIPGRIQLWGHQIAVDWAEPEQDVDEDIMCKVKILYVRNLMLSTTEDTILNAFTKACGHEGSIERVKKLKDYAFVHFRDRDDALQAMSNMNGTYLDNSMIEVVLAKPVDKAEYQRYSRGKNALPGAFSYNMAVSEPAVPAVYGQMFAHQAFLGRGLVRTAVGVRGMMRGRGRGAAGSRGAGAARGAFVPGLVRPGYRRYPPEGHYVDLLPGMELTPTNPLTLKPQSIRSVTQLLEEICQKNGWGTPSFQLHSTVTRDGSGDVQLFLYKVTIPALATTAPPFQPTKLCRTVEEAKTLAAEFCIQQLGIPLEGPELFQGRPLTVPMTVPLSNALPPPPARDITYSTVPGPLKIPPPQITGEFTYEAYHPPHGYAAGLPAYAVPPPPTM